MQNLTISEKKEILPFAKGFLKDAKQDVEEIGKRFFFLGCRLYEAQIYNYVEALGYESIEQLAETELDLGKSSTYNLINVFKRFCDRDEYGNYKTWIAPKYRKYKYSQLVEMEKAYCLPINIEKEIPHETPVRIIKNYIKYINKNPGSHKTLPEWKIEQEKAIEIPATTLQETDEELKESAKNKAHEAGLPFYDGDIDEDFNPYIYDGNMSVEDYKLMHKHIEEDEQSKRLDCNPTPKAEEKPKYDFSTRAGVRRFLDDCLQWKEKEYNSPFIGCHYYTLKNKRRIYVYIQRVASKKDIDDIYEIIHRFFIDLEQYSNVPVEITKEQFEKYCAEHKDEL